MNPQLELPISVVTVHPPRRGPSVREMVNAATRIWRQAGMRLKPEFSSLDASIEPPLLVRRYRRDTRQNELVLPTPSLITEEVRENFRRAGIILREEGFRYPHRTGDPTTHPWVRLRSMVRPASKVVVFFINLEHGTALTDRPRRQIFIQEEYRFIPQGSFYGIRYFSPTGRTLAHELGHIFMNTGRHPGDPRSRTAYIPNSGLMLQDSNNLQISARDASRVREIVGGLQPNTGQVIWLD
ncbi:MAG: hypothetical protein ACFB50_04580 [Rubrobacteraceae bacterium]